MTDQRRGRSRFYDPAPPLKRRILVWSGIALGGVMMTLLVSTLIHPRYPETCQTLTGAVLPCDAVPFTTFLGYSMLFLGMAIWILGPIVWALLGLRRGYKWEQSRTEPAEINVIILIGFIYMGFGVAVQALW